MARKALKIIGDTHGYIRADDKKDGRSYLSLIRNAEYSLQIGDMGFDYSPLKRVDATKHRILAGNHDNYDALTPHFLGDYGIYSFPNFEFFYVRGGYSIDQHLRTLGVDYWDNEELNHEQANEALDLYKHTKPKYVVTHECPARINEIVNRYDTVLPPSFTARLLQEMLEFHRPILWTFAHWHYNYRFYYDGSGKTFLGKPYDHGVKYSRGTSFILLGELGYVDIDEKGYFSELK